MCALQQSTLQYAGMSPSTSWASAKDMKKKFGISIATLKRWSKTKALRVARMSGASGKRLYSIIDVEHLLSLQDDGTQPDQSAPKKTLLYTRVSSSKQKADGDLERQQAFVSSAYKDVPPGDMYSDVGSGLNYKRKGFIAMLKRVFEGDIAQVVVAHRDRLCRFGVDFLAQSFVLAFFFSIGPFKPRTCLHWWRLL